MQPTKLSLTIASLGIAGLAMTHQASAATIPNAASGNGDLILVVTDTSTGATFEQDLGQSVGTMLPANNASFSVNDSTNANYAALLSEAGGNTANLDFAVIAGANTLSGGTTPNGQQSAYLTTSGTNVYGVHSQSALNLKNFNLIDQNIYLGLNNPPSGVTEGAGNSFYFSTSSGGTQYTQASGLWNWNGKSEYNTISAVGAASNLYFLTANGQTGYATPTLEGTANFVNGVFSFTSSNGTTPPAVPLPAAVWLLGSGLAGLVGIGRRRLAAA